MSNFLASHGPSGALPRARRRVEGLAVDIRDRYRSAKKRKEEFMDRYMIISPHTEESCAKVIIQIEAMGYITHFDWGCKGGDHTGWAIVEADNAKEALMVVPSLERSTARAIKLTRFSPDDVKKMHK